MSLQHAAQHLASHGRGDDKVLVHMTPGEVKSLNDIAMAHGGHLTINPDTGLPEAGFLSSILPMVAGAGLMAVSGGTINPMTAGLLVGGGSYLMTGSLQKGLMAGLGAYGGAGLGSSIANMGTDAASQMANAEAVTSATSGVEGEVAKKAGMNASMNLDTTIPSGGIDQLNTHVARMNPYTPAQLAEMNENLANQAGMKISSANPYASPFTTGTQEALANPIKTGYNAITESPSAAGKFAKDNWKTLAAAAVPSLIEEKSPQEATPADKDPGPKYTYAPNPTGFATGATPNPSIPSYADMRNNPSNFGQEQRYFNPVFTKDPNYVKMANGGPIEQMSNANAIGANTGFPQAYDHTHAYATPYQTPISQNVLTGASDVRVDPYTGEQKLATGGISDAGYNLGGYSDGGRLLRGPGDGVSDDIPAMIGQKQPARLADGEFVVPARIVSELGNGSTEAGARKLYAMMDRVQSARKKTVGKDKVAHNSRSEKYLPA